MMPMDKLTEENATFCFLDFDWNGNRSKLARAAAFVDATDTRYGFSNKDLLRLGGAELAHRIEECYDMDHEWGGGGGIMTRPPAPGNRVVVKLFWNESPLACENFATLCANGSQGRSAPIGQSGKPLTYRGSNVHRVVPGFVIQGGDFVKGNGSGGESIYNGKKFKDENKLAHHDKRGILSMGNAGKNANSSQFFFTFQGCPQCDGKHTIFGEIISGFSVLEALEQLGTEGGTPSAPVTIADCGIWHPTISPGAGFWLDKPDPEAYSGMNPVFIARPRVAVVASSAAVVEKFENVLQGCVVVGVFSSTEKDTSSSPIQQRVVDLLNSFAVDVVVVAPACSQEITTPLASLAPTWIGKTVVVHAKPVQALAAIKEHTWLNEQSAWIFEWT